MAHAADVYLSDLTPISARNGYGPYERDMTNGGLGAGDGRTITLNRVTYSKGLGVSPLSTLTYALSGSYSTFAADVGVDDVITDADPGSVVFEVWGDGVKLFDSGVMRAASATKQVNVGVAGKNELKLVVTDGGDGTSYDHADWADARLSSGASSSTTTTKASSTTTAVSSTTTTKASSTTTSTTAPPVSSSTTTTSPPPPGSANSAHRMVVWLPDTTVASLSDADLDLWKSRGVGGFAMIRGRVVGGGQDFTGDPNHSLVGSRYEAQRRIRDTKIVARAKARGMKMYWGYYLVNYYNTATPLVEWFDDAGWANTVVPRVSDFSAAAKLLGFDGVAMDHELYVQTGGAKTASWNVGYPGNTHTYQQTVDKVKQRGREMMTAMLDGFPGVDVLAYDVDLPESWYALMLKENYGIIFTGDLLVPFWDGISFVEGYSAIRFIDATFYKGIGLPGATWDTAMGYNASRIYALLSRQWANWNYAASRFHLSPFVWIDAGLRTWEAARPPAYVTEQLAAARKWGTGGEFADYSQSFTTFNYGPYVPGMQAATTPGVVDSSPPAVAVTGTTKKGSTATLTGTADDNLAVRSVRAQSSQGGRAVAQQNWQINSGTYQTGYEAQTNWSIAALPLGPGTNTISVTVEDIKGLTSKVTVTIAN